jgi:hypothetical protein
MKNVTVSEKTLNELLKWVDDLNEERIKNMSIPEKVKTKINHLAFAGKKIKEDLAGVEIIPTNLTFAVVPKFRDKTEFILLHHAGNETADIYEVEKWHKERKWLGFGYHFFIDLEGKVHRGRNVYAVGSHCFGIMNRIAIGICFQGNYEERKVMPEAQKNAGIKLIKQLRKNPDFENTQVAPHSKYFNTLCPGTYFPGELLEQ